MAFFLRCSWVGVLPFGWSFVLPRYRPFYLSKTLLYADFLGVVR
ncbi:hypothetical protein [Faucicola atlantae]|nr:hypothetical protein [Moraxella atlantae]